MSSNLGIFLLFIALEVTIIVAFFIVAKYLDLLTKQLDATRKLYSESFEKLVEAYDGLRLVDDMRQELYHKIVDSDDNMQKLFEQGYEIDKKIIETWKAVQDSYSDAYEEYRHCIDKLESLDKANADIYAKLLAIEENTKPIEITIGEPDDLDWDPFDDDDDFGDEEDDYDKF